MPSKASSASSPDAVVRGAVVALVLAAWCALWLWGRSPYGHLLLHGPAHVHLAVVRQRWFASVFIGGWTLMTVAMMLPSSLPLILMFHRMVRDRATSSWLVSLLVAAYLGIWALCGVVLLLLNWLLHAGVASVSWLATKPWLVGAIILIIAGLYQFSSLKYACLDKCRAPLSFVMSRWQGGNESVQAMRIGVEHGLFCVGCCWSLMLLMFLVSTGSLLWMLLLGIVMALEKNLSWGRRLSAPIGLLLLLGAAAVLIGGVRI
jgi:predicted metal-binding membrane protein